MVYKMELIKNVAAVVGCVSACIALIITVFKPIRATIVSYIRYKTNESKSEQERLDILTQIAVLNQTVATLTEAVNESRNDNAAIMKRIDGLQEKVLLNESDRLKSELFACGNQCRRGIVLHPEEFDHIREVYKKYNEELGQNHNGTMEFEYIYNYYNSQELK